MSRCTDHCYHRECLEQQCMGMSYLKCAVCSITYGDRVGDQPPGTMEWSREPWPCDGHPQTQTWAIQYKFWSGFTSSGQQYRGDQRNCYVPDTEKGRELLALLVKAFKRKLTFTVGYSVVRARDNCIVWNGIHHKTNTHGGTGNYGYPDPTYCNRATIELADKGVVIENLQKETTDVTCSRYNKIHVP